MSAWIATKVVSKEAPEERAQVIESFISIGMELLDFHDFSGAMTVLSSLNSAPVARLKNSWDVCNLQVEYRNAQTNSFSACVN